MTILGKDQNLSEVLFKPTRKSLETSFISNSDPFVYLRGGQIVDKDTYSWYRTMHSAYWGWLNFDIIELKAVMAKIANSDEKRTRANMLDTVYEYGPGNWIYEFSMVGRKYLDLYREQKAEKGNMKAFKLCRLAYLYFSLAAYPYLHGDEYGDQALLEHYKCYRLASKLIPGEFYEFPFEYSKQKISCFVHVPNPEKLSPMVVICSNMLNLSTEYLRFYVDCLAPLGIAMAVIDLPGTGLSGKVKMSENLGDLHEEALKCIFANLPCIDRSRIGLLAQRVGCQTAARLMINHSECIKCAVMAVPALHEGFMVNNLKIVPSMFRAVIANRIGFDAANWDLKLPQLQVFSVKKQGLFQGITLDVPLLVLTSKKDILYAPEDVRLAASLCRHSEIKEINSSGIYTDFSCGVKMIAEYFSKNLIPDWAKK